MSSRKEHHHLVGVAGVGMNALAQAMLARGWSVSGSDRYLDRGESLEVLAMLRERGVALVPQDGSGITPDTRAVVVSTAIEPDNADLAAAQRAGVRVLHRAEMLAQLVAGRTCLAVTGTSGKTTVTGLVGWILECLGEDPTVVNGGAVVNWAGEGAGGNVRAGQSDLWVVEADESDRSLLRFRPDWAVVTNVSKDHFDVPETIELFRSFAGQVKQGVVCGEGVAALLGRGAKGAGRLIEEPYTCREEGGAWGFSYGGVDFNVPLPGRHNAENAFLAAVLCGRLGHDLARVRDAIASFRGIRRRLEKIGEAGGISVVDDYAHNPAKIRAAWLAVAPAAGRVIGVWRPHGYGPLAAMQEGLAETLAGIMRTGDCLFVLPVYYAGGTAQRTVSSEDFVERLRGRGVAAAYADDYGRLMEQIVSICGPGDTVLCMGARDPDLPRFARELLRRLARAG